MILWYVHIDRHRVQVQYKELNGFNRIVWQCSLADYYYRPHPKDREGNSFTLFVSSYPGGVPPSLDGGGGYPPSSLGRRRGGGLHPALDVGGGGLHPALDVGGGGGWYPIQPWTGRPPPGWGCMRLVSDSDLVSVNKHHT